VRGQWVPVSHKLKPNRPQPTHPPPTHIDEAALALECLLDSGALDAARLTGGGGGGGLRGAAERAGEGEGGALIPPAEALMW
jgi:hypothetical protein